MKLISKILYVLFVLLLIGVAGIFLASLLPIPGNIEIKIVKSGSMEPTIKTGGIVVVKPLESYAVGDVITFGEDSPRAIPTTHRILEVISGDSGISYQTKGDANEEQDPEVVMAGDVIGKVIFSVPFVGYVLDFARKPLGFTLLIGVPAGVIILDEMGRIYSEVRAMRRKKRLEAEVSRNGVES
jgi:signal peptidase I